MKRTPSTTHSPRKRNGSALFAAVVALLLLSFVGNIFLLITRVPIGRMMYEKKDQAGVDRSMADRSELLSRIATVFITSRVNADGVLDFPERSEDDAAILLNGLKNTTVAIEDRGTVDAAKALLEMIGHRKGMIRRHWLKPDSAHALKGQTNISVVSSTIDGGTILVVNGLLIPDGVHCYELWYMRGGKALPGELFSSQGAEGQALVTLAAFSAIRTESLAISIEPAGGSMSPTTKPFAVTVWK